MSGGYDLSVTISGETFQQVAFFVARRLSPMDGVLSTATHFVLRTYKKDGALFGLENKDERQSTV
jgi:DNA-binding Lrp family transcriptional regulator